MAPYYPSSNGEAERFVKSFKNAFRAMDQDKEKDPIRKVQQFVFSYRNTPHSTTGMSPAELLIGRRLRGRLDLLKHESGKNDDAQVGSNPEAKVSDSHFSCRPGRNDHMIKETKEREFNVGDAVWVKGQRNQQSWLPGVIIQRHSIVSYTVNVQDQLCRRRVDHLRKREVSALEEEEERCPNEEGNNVEKPGEEPQNATQADQQTQGERSQQSSPERNDQMVTPPIAPRISTWIRFPPVRGSEMNMDIHEA